MDGRHDLGANWQRQMLVDLGENGEIFGTSSDRKSATNFQRLPNVALERGASQSWRERSKELRDRYSSVVSAIVSFVEPVAEGMLFKFTASFERRYHQQS